MFMRVYVILHAIAGHTYRIAGIVSIAGNFGKKQRFPKINFLIFFVLIFRD